MLPRGTLDIGFSDLLAGLYYCAFNAKYDNSEKLLENLWGDGYSTVATLSVRSGFDVLLSALDLPQGSEVIISDINIADMFTIAQSHGLVPVPVPINADTLSVDPDAIISLITDKTKMVLITHLFGSRADVSRISHIARERGLLLIEDCAQAWMGTELKNRQKADVEMYSFGLIKTNTAINGAVLRFRDDVIADRVRKLNHQLPWQKVSTFAGKIIKALILKILSNKIIYTILFLIAGAFNIDIESSLSGMTRGFVGGELLRMIRHRPSNPLLKLIYRKINNYDDAEISRRIEYAEQILSIIPKDMRIGSEADTHFHWVLPIWVDAPSEWIEYLRRYGFDATAKASRLVICPTITSQDSGNNRLADILNLNILYLPLYPKANKQDTEKLKKVILEKINSFIYI